MEVEIENKMKIFHLNTNRNNMHQVEKKRYIFFFGKGEKNNRKSKKNLNNIPTKKNEKWKI